MKNHSADVSQTSTNRANTVPPSTGSSQPGAAQPQAEHLGRVRAVERATGQAVHQHPRRRGDETQRPQAVQRDRQGHDEGEACRSTGGSAPPSPASCARPADAPTSTAPRSAGRARARPRASPATSSSAACRRSRAGTAGATRGGVLARRHRGRRRRRLRRAVRRRRRPDPGRSTDVGHDAPSAARWHDQLPGSHSVTPTRGSGQRWARDVGSPRRWRVVSAPCQGLRP